jgi:hypothetical protein
MALVLALVGCSRPAKAPPPATENEQTAAELVTAEAARQEAVTAEQAAAEAARQEAEAANHFRPGARLLLRPNKEARNEKEHICRGGSFTAACRGLRYHDKAGDRP